MLSLVSAFKNNLPGISEKAIENLTRAAIALYADKQAMVQVKRATGKDGGLDLRVNRAYLCGLVNAYRESGWLPVEHLPGNPFYAYDQDIVEHIELIVEDWIREG